MSHEDTSTDETTARRPDSQDRIGLYLTIGLIALLAAAIVVVQIRRLVELASGGMVSLTVPLDGESTMLPLGPGGAMVEAEVQTATIHVDGVAPATSFALWALPLWQALLACVAAALLVKFMLRLARGRAFSGGASHLVYAGVTVAIFGGLVSRILENMTTNGALSAVSDYTYDSVTFGGNVMFAVAALVLAAVGVAFRIGERLHKDTEGLV